MVHMGSSIRGQEDYPTETEYGEMMEEPHQEVDDIVSFDKYISVVVKL